MKIVMLTNVLNPYRTTFFKELNRQLLEKGIDFKVLVMVESEPERPWRYDEYKQDFTFLLKGRTLKLADTYLFSNPGIIKKLEREKADILIVGGSYTHPTVIQVARNKKKLCKSMYFWSESHLGEERQYSSIKYKIRDFLRNYIYKKFDGFWYSGKKSLELIEKYKRNESKLIFVPNLINQSEFYKAKYITDQEKGEIRKRYSVEGKFVFVLPARLNPVKGIDKFFELYKQCKNKDNTVILICGTGNEKEKLVSFAEKYCINAQFLGYKSQEEMVKLYSIADFFLLPSISDPNPLTSIEASWAGCPLLVSEHVGNYPELVSEGQNGYVFSYNDPKNAIELIDKVISSDNVWLERAREKSRQIAMEKYDIDLSIKNLIDKLLIVEVNK